MDNIDGIAVTATAPGKAEALIDSVPYKHEIKIQNERAENDTVHSSMFVTIRGGKKAANKQIITDISGGYRDRYR